MWKKEHRNLNEIFIQASKQTAKMCVDECMRAKMHEPKRE